MIRKLSCLVLIVAVSSSVQADTRKSRSFSGGAAMAAKVSAKPTSEVAPSSDSDRAQLNAAALAKEEQNGETHHLKPRSYSGGAAQGARRFEAKKEEAASSRE